MNKAISFLPKVFFEVTFRGCFVTEGTSVCSAQADFSTESLDPGRIATSPTGTP